MFTQLQDDTVRDAFECYQQARADIAGPVFGYALEPATARADWGEAQPWPASSPACPTAIAAGRPNRAAHPTRTEVLVMVSLGIRAQTP
ncbi:MAG TPA: hypothetical protein VMF65_21935 [Acidimicrobiales bacterium]|nr:hypothetical protein [Acidimicrobiales bacterium]